MNSFAGIPHVCFLAHSIGTQVKATNDGECYELIPLVLGLVRCGPVVQGLVQRRLLKGLVQLADIIIFWRNQFK